MMLLIILGTVQILLLLELRICCGHLEPLSVCLEYDSLGRTRGGDARNTIRESLGIVCFLMYLAPFRHHFIFERYHGQSNKLSWLQVFVLVP